nr:glycosyltransferase [Cryobacterium roopkundense]
MVHVHSPASVEPVRIVHVSSAHPWTDNRVHLREAASLASAGYSVSLIAVDSDGTVPETGVRVVRLPKRRRLNRVTLGTLAAVVAGLRTRASVFHLHDPELVWSVPLLRLLGKKVIYDAHEDLPTQVLGKHYANQKVMPAFIRLALIVVWLSKFSNHVIAATETIAARYNPARVTVVHNYPKGSASDSRAAPAAERPFGAVYVGAIDVNRGALQMVDAAGSQATASQWKLELAGPIADDSLRKRLELRAGWAHVNFHGQVSPSDARLLVASVPIGLVVLQSTPAYLDSLPTKMFEYMSAGTAIIASDFPLWRDIIEKHNCGVLVDETSVESITAAIDRYASDPDLLKLHGNNARKAAKSFTWAQEESVLLSVYERLICR